MGKESQSFVYTRLSGREVISAVVADLVERMRTDDRLGRFWGIAAAPTRMKLAVDFLCEVTGGPSCYMGRNMKTAHAGLGIDAKDYLAFTGHLKATLAKFSVSAQESNEIMAFISSLESEIVENRG
jgi:hemoglobin